MLKSVVVISLILITTADDNSIKEEVFTKTKGRIVGGSSAPENLYPYQVSLRLNGNHMCGGSIVAHEWIVTAAHCVARVPISKLKVIAGSNKIYSGGFMYDVTEVHIHENYNSWFLINDVAMLKVKYINYANNIKPILLEDKYIHSGVSCILSGWGMKFFPGPTPNELQHIDLTTTTVRFCKFMLQPINDNQLCTFSKAEEGACRYDSGGPLVRKVNGTTKQIGVVSWGILCALGFPDVHSRISSYYNWFKTTCNGCL